MIVGQNALLNQYVPSFYIKDIRDGQGIIYDSIRKSFVNLDIGRQNSDFVPYYVAVNETFTVPLYKQALFSIPIINDGTIVVDGYLIGV